MQKSTFIFIVIIILVFIGVGAYFLLKSDATDYVSGPEDEITVTEPEVTEPEEEQTKEVVEAEPEPEPETNIGTSAGGRDITAYHYPPRQTGGERHTELLFIGGIHGGYEWNTVLLAYELMDYLEENPGAIPENVRVTVIPAMNPDGLFEVVGTTARFTEADVPSSQEATIPGRFNGNGVDLNRNFDCDWQSEGTWQNRTVDGGDEPFSEPESQAVRDYVEVNEPAAAVVFYSAVGGVFASNCHNGVMPETLTLTNLYADAAGYRAYESFDFYTITGDMVNWFANNEIPAISVLLTTHEDVEWDKNRAGIEALFEHYAE